MVSRGHQTLRYKCYDIGAVVGQERTHEPLDDRLGPYQLIRRKREMAIVGLY